VVSEPGSSVLRALVGSELSSVVFVHDYLQLVFQPASLGAPEPRVLRPAMTGAFGTLSAFTLPKLHIDGRPLGSSQPGYRDTIVQQIGRRVTSADVDEESLRLEFDNGVLATLSLGEDDLVAGQVESAMLQLDDDAKSWMVWRPGDRAG
jgi:hypothetical protein